MPDGSPRTVCTEPMVVGLETEMAVSVEAPPGLMTTEAGLAFLRFGSPPGWSWPRDQFLANGARLYVDVGDHPEYATPECSTIRELVAADAAGLEIAARMAARAEKSLGEALGAPVRMRVMRNNVSPNGFTWGSHENYLAPAALSWGELAIGLASHLSSRVCFAGSGTILAPPGEREHGRFRLSQRAPFMNRLADANSMIGSCDKPMVLTRDEPLADPTKYRRVQVICGDSSMSQTATMLKIGSTVLAIRLLSAGLAPKLRLDDPVKALHVLGGDPEVSTTVATERGNYRAIDIQWIWLAAANRMANRHGLPDAESQVLAEWESVLTDLEADSQRLVDRLDWVAKRAVLDRVATRDGLALGHAKLVCVDLAYHDVREDRSLYRHLVRAGTMRTLVDDDEVAAAIERPPRTTRAHARGAMIQHLRDIGVDFEASWQWIRANRAPISLLLHFGDPLAPWSAEQDRFTESLDTELARLEIAGSSPDSAA